MNVYYITGTSRGIGKALVDKLLEDENNFIYGLSRNNFILHDRYEHIRIDLADLTQVKSFRFLEHKRTNKIVLINNAGTIGEIYQLGKLENDDIINTFNLNIITPTILINNFLNTYSSYLGEKQIMNISSGAGRHSYPSWSVYCATKSALDMVSEVANDENSGDNDFKIWSVAPGIVDTKMQEEIRSSNESEFPMYKKFVDYKENNLLSNPLNVADDLIKILNSNYNSVKLDIRNLE